jgi:hypothetical protein
VRYVDVNSGARDSIYGQIGLVVTRGIVKARRRLVSRVIAVDRLALN